MRIIIKKFKPSPWWTEAMKESFDPAIKNLAKALEVGVEYVHENPAKAHRLLHDRKEDLTRLSYEEAHRSFDEINDLMDYLWARFKWENRKFLRDHDGSMNHWDYKKQVIEVKESPEKLFMDQIKKAAAKIGLASGAEIEVSEGRLPPELEEVFKR